MPGRHIPATTGAAPMTSVFVLGLATADFMFSVATMPTRPEKYRADGCTIVGGGCAANAAVTIARLGGAPRLAARIGDDVTGDIIAGELQGEGVDLTHLHRDPGGRSSCSSVLVDAQGERQIVNFRGAGLVEGTGWLTDVPRARAVLTDSRWREGALFALKLAREWGVPGILDAEPPTDPDLARAASHVAFSRGGLDRFAGTDDIADGLRRARRLTGAFLAVTNGADGCYWLDGDRVGHLPAPTVDPVDTLGAGDAWHGALALQLARGMGEVPAMAFANAVGALATTGFGGRAGSPTQARLDTFLKEAR